MSSEGFSFHPGKEVGMTEVEEKPVGAADHVMLGEGEMVRAAWGDEPAVPKPGETLNGEVGIAKLREELDRLNKNAREGLKVDEAHVAELEEGLRKLEQSLREPQGSASKDSASSQERIGGPESKADTVEQSFNRVAARENARFDASPLGGVKREQIEAERAAFQAKPTLMQADNSPLEGVQTEQRKESLLAAHDDYRERSEKSFAATGIADPNYQWNVTPESESLPALSQKTQPQKRSWVARLFNL
jgi:hypothetical protein